MKKSNQITLDTESARCLANLCGRHDENLRQIEQRLDVTIRNRGNEFLPYILGETNTPMPLFVKPNRKVSVKDVKNAMRDHYEGTPLEISKDFGAGPRRAFTTARRCWRPT